ncbi:FixH family protein [Catenovulum sediminis]|uniref:FixH family protein n=1 Tax=Catenovulum sediminis TaxID=1740262 RepID=A0ABV1RJI2_9ALTE|nr:FixH family protein [Catenovulum sediminis]
MNQTDVRPWYKEPWPWVLIAIIVLPMLVAAVRMSIYSEYQVEMVVDDYYKKGKAINQEFDRETLARDYGIAIFAEVSDQQILLDVNRNQKAPQIASLIVSFYHSTQSHKDQQVMATARADGIFSADLLKATEGKWQLTIEPHDKSWKVQKVVQLPHQGKILITPH